MAMDGLSYTSTSRLRALLCPIGRIRRSRFLEFVERVHMENIVRLGDVSPDVKPNRTMFSPQGFPNGQIVYNLTTTHDRDHEYLEPFEPHRRTFLVIAVADFTENNPVEILLSQFEDLRAIYRRALFHTCLIFDSPSSALLPVPKIRPNDDRDTSKYFIPVPTKRESRTTSMRTIMCDITSCLLSEFTGYARTLQSLPTVESPLASGVAEEAGLAPPATNNRMSMPSIAGASVIGGLQQQRMSMQGFGSGTVTERARSKGKGRVQIAIAELYMLTGRIPDALKEFVEGANIARNNNDHLWHGKALNGIGVCLVILAYLGIDFQIPNIPYPTLDAKSASKSTPTPPKTPTPGTDSTPSRSSTSTADPQQLLELIPELGTTILNLYNRSSNFQGETIPQICFSESVIRHAKFMASVYLANGLNIKSLTNIVLGDLIMKPEIIERKIPGLPDKREISASVMRAYPNPIEALTVLDASKVLGGIASVLGSIGFQRRKAMITRELIRILIPGLIQARVVGAAGAGIHPAAGLSAASGPIGPVSGGSGGALDIMEDEVEIGVMGLLEDMCSAYGIVRKFNQNTAANEPTDEVRGPSEEIVAENELRAFGWTALKIHVLRSCMSLCEALPDFNGVLKFTAQLLKMGGSDLLRDEQIKLASNISRTISAAGKLGMTGVVTSYWDAFLLREVELVESSLWKSPTSHAKNELQDADSTDIQAPIIANKNPFIYNPFARKRETAAAEQVLVQGELAEFRVTLQNPFEFDVEIESIALDVTGVEFVTEKQGVVLSPFRTQQLSIFGKPTGTGNMTVVGCRIRVFGCVEKSFPILTQGFDYGKLDIKIKRMGLPILEQKPVRLVSTMSNAKRASAKPPLSQFPTPKTILVTVIENQPLVLAHSSSLPQSALMVLEGERKVFNIVFQNLTDVPVDILLFSFQDSTTTQLQAALASKNMQPSEIYEYEILLLKKRALLWKNQTQKPKPLPSINGASTENNKKECPVIPFIAPHSTASFDIEVLGKPGLTNASVQMDYGYLGVPRDQVTGKFYTRQVVFPVTITVNASIELLRVDFIPFQTSVDFPETDGVSTGCGTINDKSEQIKKLFRQAKVRDEPSEYCLMTLDFRNAWPQPLKVNLQVREPPKSLDEEEAEWINTYETSDTIQAGHQSRFIALIKRVYLSNPTAKIPSLSGTQRQFVVSTTKPTADQERLSREAFWFREEILKCIRGTWEEVGTQRRGEVELRNFRLSPRMVETVRVDDVGIRMEIIPTPGSLQKSAPNKFTLQTDQFYNLRTTITNRTTRSILPILRLSPSLRNQHISVALDLSRRFAFDGLLQQAIHRISPGECTSVEMGFVVLCRGEFEVTAGVEEVRAGRGGEDAEKEVKKLGPDGIPEDILEGVVGERSWVGREVMTMVVRDKV
ncbi:Trs120-domain-containing protein [Terfezia boudieri ATCC MYA-4762]|uniref:Trs120-domain-containing protein n=1 Tax=Terfezia boudieri ATCC MYA-4762 TaxID=1051890 RepID=A0A3N4LS58_9PEZI|nr:Trs120-domain-containing protein [Terfezia boudieri ATCC MYA-4762]